jgi:hypothetical protein
VPYSGKIRLKTKNRYSNTAGSTGYFTLFGAYCVCYSNF